MEEKFLGAIGADPDDDTVRLVYADWLDENGGGDRAEFIRVQVELARPVGDDQRGDELRRRESEILAARRDEWVGELADTAPAAAWVFRRGFVDGLDLRGHEVGPDGAAALAASPHLAYATTLDLTGNRVGDEGARALASSRHAAHLRSLDLTANVIDLAALELALSPFMGRLTSLRLGQNVIRDAGWTALYFALQGERLEVLDLSSNPIPDSGPRPVTDLPYRPRLAALDLSKTLAGNAAAAGLADTPALSLLRTLDLSCT
jgi:uncharacterized protein (TIGR02996 family)